MARVMIVDDSPTDVLNLKGILQKAGHEVIESTSGQDALTRVRNEMPDVVIMDVVMAGVNGFQATRTLSKDQATAKIPIVVVSSKNQETDRVRRSEAHTSELQPLMRFSYTVLCL